MPNFDDSLKINRDLSLLAPKVKELALAALADCHKAGYQMEVFEAFRSPQRQLQLYTLGRTSRGKVVTNAYSWYSFHQYGLAVDIAYFINGKWSWQENFEKPGAIFMQHGFDKPPTFEQGHFQISNGLHIAEVKRLYDATSTFSGLWDEMDLN